MENVETNGAPQEVRDVVVPEKRAAIEVVPGRGLVPTDFDQLWRVANAFAASGLLPKGLQRPEQAMVAFQMGMELGLTIMQSVQSIAVINGRPSVFGDTPLALVKNSGQLETIREEITGEKQAIIASCMVKRKGEKDPVIRSFSMADAATAGLLSKDSWKGYPKRMCQMRARSWALKDVFPDILKGIGIAEYNEPGEPVGDDKPSQVSEVPPDLMDALGAPAAVTVQTDEKAASEEAPEVEKKPTVPDPDPEEGGIIDAEVDDTTGTQGDDTPPPDEEPPPPDTQPDDVPDEEPPEEQRQADNPVLLSKWISKRFSKDRKQGFHGYVMEHIEAFRAADKKTQAQAEKKYRSLYPRATVPWMVKGMNAGDQEHSEFLEIKGQIVEWLSDKRSEKFIKQAAQNLNMSTTPATLDGGVLLIEEASRLASQHATITGGRGGDN